MRPRKTIKGDFRESYAVSNIKNFYYNSTEINIRPLYYKENDKIYNNLRIMLRKFFMFT